MSCTLARRTQFCKPVVWFGALVLAVGVVQARIMRKSIYIVLRMIMITTCIMIQHFSAV